MRSICTRSKVSFLTLALALVSVTTVAGCMDDEEAALEDLAEDDAEIRCPTCPDLGAFEPPVVPAALQPPAGAQLKRRYHATGSQIYTCQALPAGGYAWTFKAPDAVLFDASCQAAGTHGAGPFWRWNADGSTVVARKLAEAPAPVARAVPWLLLAATSNTPGRFGDIAFLQRVNTTGGVAPTTGCNAYTVGREKAVPYTALYTFWSGGATPAP